MTIARLGLMLSLVGCTAGAGVDSADTDAPVDADAVVIHQLKFARAVDGVSEGVDLDGVSSTAGGGSGCGVADLQSPDGTPGVDNSFAALLPALEAIGAEAIEPLIQAAVDSGELLLLIETLDDAAAGEDCVRLTVTRGVGEPTIGGHGQIVAGQTFDRSSDVEASVVECAIEEGGVTVGAPFELQLPLIVFDESINLTLLDGVIHLERRDDGTVGGFVSGGVATQQLQENIASLDGVESEIINLATSALAVRADLAPDESGTCQRMSVVMTFEAVSAYFFE